AKPCRDVQIAGCTMASHWGPVKMGTESMGDFEDIRISRCSFSSGQGGIKILSVDGANIKNIEISDIAMSDVTVPIFIRLGARMKSFKPGDNPREEIGSIRGVTIRNVKVSAAGQIGVLVSGIPEHPIENVSLVNLEMTLPGGGKADDAKVSFEEKE